MRKRKSTRTPTFGFYGGVAGAVFGLLVPAALGIEEYAGLFQILYGAVGFVVGMGVAVLLAKLTDPESHQSHH